MIIDQLPAIQSVQKTDELAIERGTNTYKATVMQIVGGGADLIAAQYDSTATYAVGDYCIYESVLYICTTAIVTPEEWDSTHWSATNVTDAKQDKITDVGMLKGDGSAVSAADLGTDYGAKSFYVTLYASGWTNNTYTAQSTDFVVSGYSYVVAPKGQYVATYSSCQIYADNVLTTGQMTFHCTVVPTSVIEVAILRVVSA